MFETGSRSCLYWENLFGFHENLTVGCRCMGFSNEQYQCDDGHHIRDHGDQVRGYHIALGCQGTDTTAKSEQQTCLGRALRRELAKDHCRYRDEALSHDNAGTELVDGCQGHERCRQGLPGIRTGSHRYNELCIRRLPRDSHASGCSPTALK